MADVKACRLCKIKIMQKNISSKKAISLFSSRGIKQQLAGRIGKLLGVPQPAPDASSPPSFVKVASQKSPSWRRQLQNFPDLKP